MSPRADGKPHAPAFFRYNDHSASNADPIAIDELARSEWIMEQITAHWSAIPATSESLTLVKDSVDGPEFDTTLIDFDPNVENVQDLVCNQGFRFTKGDRVVIAYPNTDDNDVGVEIMIRQVW